MTKIEQYIKEAFEEQAGNFKQVTLENVTINHDSHIDAGTFDVIADAIKAQAVANKITAEALLEVAKGIEGIKAIGVNIE